MATNVKNETGQIIAVLMTKTEWAKTSRDFKTNKIGSDRGRWIIRLTDQGSTFVPVQLLNA